MLLTLDAGNSSVKFGLFLDGSLIKKGKIDLDCDLQQYVESVEYAQINKIVSSSVLSDFRLKGLPNVEHTLIGVDSKFPFNINYNSPHTLGVDRLVACAGAYKAGVDYLVIDVGTCVTYDLVTAVNGFEGGAIAPGLSVRLKGMHNYTERLPLIDVSNITTATTNGVLGKNTRDCMLSGALNGLKFEILGFIDAFQSLYPNLKVYLTGGGSEILGKELKSDIFANQNLVLEGLHYLSKLND